MKFNRSIAYVLAVVLLFSNITLISNAATYSDVPSWAQKAVNKVSEEGLMVGNSNGKFEPYEKVSYFKLIDILATMAGYKDPVIDSSITDEEKNYIENAYKVNKWILQSYESKYDKWEKSKGEKIAYLLQKGILDQADLSLFVEEDKSGTEVLGYVTKEALSKYLVRSIGQEEKALGSAWNTSFSDNSSISDMYKPFVSLLKELGIVSGGTDNKFNPQENVTRVILAVFINNVLEYQDEAEETTEVPNVELQEVIGTVTDVYDYTGMKAIRINITDTNSVLYKLADKYEIYKDGVSLNKNLIDAVSKDNVIKVLINSDNNIVKIYLNPKEDINSGNNTGNNNTGNNTGTGNNTTTPKDTTIQYEEITGSVENLVSTAAGYKMTLKVQYVAWGEIKETTKEYILSQDVIITQNGKHIEIHEVELGSIALAKVHNGKIYSADIKTKKHSIEGTVIGREMYENKSVIKIEDEEGQIRDYIITSDTKIFKQGIKNPTFDNIMIGNILTIEAEYDVAIEIYTSTDYNTYIGLIEKIEISKYPKIAIKTEDGKVHELFMGYDASLYDGDKLVNIYDLKLGYKVEVNTDSDELSSLEITNKYSMNTVEGIITEVYDDEDEIVVKIKSDDISGQYYLKTITMDNSTKVYQNGSYLSKSKLEEDMRVIITLDKNDNSEADTIHVIN